MPDPATLLLFAAASATLLVVPGPTIALVVARSLGEGRRVALPLVLGVGLGDLTAASVALAGAGALLAASAAAFTAVKLLGAAYLVWLGVRLFLAEPRAPAADIGGEGVGAEGAGAKGTSARGTGAWGAFRDGFLVTVFNPKGILFFVAFVPQFIRPEASYAGQASVFVLAFTALGILNGTLYALGADALRSAIRSPGVLRWMNRAGGVAIAGAGVAALFARRPAV